MLKTSSTLRKNIIRFGIFASVFFLVATVLAMIVYPGGTVTNNDAEHYLFTNNFFSDLGRTQDFCGNPQPFSTILFSAALGLGGIAYFALFLIMPHYFRQVAGGQKLAKFGSVMGILSAVCFVGVAATPWNLLPDAHMVFVKTAMPLFLIMSVFYTFAILKTPDYPRFYLIIFCFFIVILLAYLYLLFFGPKSNTPIGLTIQATGQKILVYSQIFTMLIQAYGLLQKERTADVTELQKA